MSTAAGEATFSKVRSGPGSTAFYAARVGLALAALAGITALIVAMQPRLELIAAAPAHILVHFYSALGAACLGLVLMAWRKGRAFHRAFGWLWVYAVAVAVVSSFWIRDEQGGFTWIHLSTIFHGGTLALAVFFALRRNIKWHRRFMLYTYWVGIVGAISLGFIPDRLLWQAFFA